MANIVRRTFLQDGSKYSTVHWYFESDGTDGELNNYVLLDPAVDFPSGRMPPQTDETGLVRPPKLTVRSVWLSTAWFDITLGFESTVNNYYITLARDADFDMNYKQFGGIMDKTDPGDLPTGRLICKTRDFAPAGSNGFIVLELKKD